MNPLSDDLSNSNFKILTSLACEFEKEELKEDHKELENIHPQT